MEKELKQQSIRLHTTLEQTNDLLRCGYPLPKNTPKKPYPQAAYSIGELIDFAKRCAGDIIVTNNRNSGWLVGVYGTHVANKEADELIDALVEFCKFIKLNNYY